MLIYKSSFLNNKCIIYTDYTNTGACKQISLMMRKVPTVLGIYATLLSIQSPHTVHVQTSAPLLDFAHLTNSCKCYELLPALGR